MEALRTPHACWELYCSCGQYMGGCEHAKLGVLPNLAESRRLTRTSGCADCVSKAQYLAFEEKYKPLPASIPKETPNVMLGSGDGAKPVTIPERKCPNCDVKLSGAGCSVCGRFYQ